jgi:hypothetical protein
MAFVYIVENQTPFLASTFIFLLIGTCLLVHFGEAENVCMMVVFSLSSRMPTESSHLLSNVKRSRESPTPSSKQFDFHNILLLIPMWTKAPFSRFESNTNLRMSTTCIDGEVCRASYGGIEISASFFCIDNFNSDCF